MCGALIRHRGAAAALGPMHQTRSNRIIALVRRLFQFAEGRCLQIDCVLDKFAGNHVSSLIIIFFF